MKYCSSKSAVAQLAGALIASITTATPNLLKIHRFQFNYAALRSLTSVVLLTSICGAKASLTLVNAGFEDPPIIAGYTSDGAPGWSIYGGGVWNINNSPLGFWTVPAPEGNQVAWFDWAPGGGMTQTVTDQAMSGQSYTFTGWAGHPLGYGVNYGGGGNPTIYTAAILIGDVPVASYSGTGPETMFGLFSVSYTAVPGDAGKTIGVQLSANHAQTAFDGLSLTAAAVPEPSTYVAGALLFLPFGAHLLRRLRTRN